MSDDAEQLIAAYCHRRRSARKKEKHSEGIDKIAAAMLKRRELTEKS